MIVEYKIQSVLLRDRDMPEFTRYVYEMTGYDANKHARAKVTLLEPGNWSEVGEAWGLDVWESH